MCLEKRRKEINEIDAEIVDMLAKRIATSREIINSKTKNNIGILDADREKQIIKRVRKIAEENGLEPDFVEDIFARILEESQRIN